MAFRRDTENRNLPSSAELTEIAVGGYDYALRYETNSYDTSPFPDHFSVDLERKNHKDIVEVHFSEERFDEIVETVNKHMASDQEEKREHINDRRKYSWL